MHDEYSKLDPASLSKGDIIQYEEGHRIACIMKVQAKIPSRDGFVEYKGEVLEPMFGTIAVGDNFTFGFNKSNREMWNQYEVWEAKEPGSMTTYINGSVDMDDHREYLDFLKKKYRDDD